MDAARRLILHHRRLLAAIFAGLAALSALTALRPSTPGETVVVAQRDLASGTVIEVGDLDTVELTSVPSHAHSSTDDLIGQRVAAPMRKGEALTDYRLLATSLLDGYGEGQVLATVRIGDRAQLTGLTVGSFVSVLGSDPQGESPPEVLTRRAQVAAMPATDDREDAPGLTLAVDEKAGRLLTTAGQRLQLSVISVP